MRFFLGGQTLRRSIHQDRVRLHLQAEAFRLTWNGGSALASAQLYPRHDHAGRAMPAATASPVSSVARGGYCRRTIG